MGKRGPKPSPWQDLVAAGRRSEAEKRRAMIEDGELKLKAWSREIPGPETILDPLDAIMLVPGYDPYLQAGDAFFVPELAERVVAWFHKHITHVSCDLAGQAYQLTPLEQGILGNLFGWIKPDGSRRFRKALIYVPRKFGKTSLCAGLSLYGLFEEENGDWVEQGVQAYCAAYTRDQAAKLWGPACSMVKNDRELSSWCRVYGHSIVRFYKGTREGDGSYFQTLSADANSAHSLNPYIYTVDELHTQKNAKLLDALDSGVGSRRQPMGIRITSAAIAGESICNEEYEHAKKVRDGVVEDREYLPVIFEADVEDDPHDPATWAKANPKFPATPTRTFMEGESKKAKLRPRYLNTFLRHGLNIRTNAESAWLSLPAWDACSKVPADAQIHERVEPYADLMERARDQADGEGGLDLAKTTDLTAFALWFPTSKILLSWFWMPKDTAAKREDQDGVPYLAWAEAGFVKLTSGNVTDYNVVESDLLEICATFGISRIAFDPWNATQMSLNLQDQGLELVAMRQNYPTLSEPSKLFERMVVAHEIDHGGQPVMRWNVSCAMVDEAHDGAIKPSKLKAKQQNGRIDGVAAAVMAIRIATTSPEEAGSVYSGGGESLFL